MAELIESLADFERQAIRLFGKTLHAHNFELYGCSINSMHEAVLTYKADQVALNVCRDRGEFIEVNIGRSYHLAETSVHCRMRATEDIDPSVPIPTDQLAVYLDEHYSDLVAFIRSPEQIELQAQGEKARRKAMGLDS